MIKVDAFRPGDALIQATNSTSMHPLFLEVRAPKLGPVGRPPLTKTRKDSKFLSSDEEFDPHDVNTGRPINPIGTGRKINLGGEQETPGFEDYSVNLPFSGYRRNFFGGKFIFRPFTEDTDPAVRVQDGEASDICIRGNPIKDDTIFTIKRIAAPKCRFTFAGDKNLLPLLKRELGGVGFKVIEEFAADGDIVMQRG